MFRLRLQICVKPLSCLWAYIKWNSCCPYTTDFSVTSLLSVFSPSFIEPLISFPFSHFWAFGHSEVRKPLQPSRRVASWQKAATLAWPGLWGNKELHSRLEQLIIQLPLEHSARVESLYSCSYHGSFSQNEAKESSKFQNFSNVLEGC